jgi:glycerophosphoryl diester phosphodiesterase
MARSGAARPAKPRVIAHRGASAYRPENTLAAYELAIEQAADMIEVDLHRTRDGAVVVAHDAELERIGGRGEIGDATPRCARWTPGRASTCRRSTSCSTASGRGSRSTWS